MLRYRDGPFGRIAFLLDLSKDTFGFVVDAMATFGHLPITLDLFLSTHVTSLQGI